jgi:hypothetical protein
VALAAGGPGDLALVAGVAPAADEPDKVASVAGGPGFLRWTRGIEPAAYTSVGGGRVARSAP